VALCPAQLAQALPKSGNTSLSFWIALSICHQHTDPPHALGPLRAWSEIRLGGRDFDAETLGNRSDPIPPDARA
jgi:hypothetical protein